MSCNELTHQCPNVRNARQYIQRDYNAIFTILIFQLCEVGSGDRGLAVLVIYYMSARPWYNATTNALTDLDSKNGATLGDLEGLSAVNDAVDIRLVGRRPIGGIRPNGPCSLGGNPSSYTARGRLGIDLDRSSSGHSCQMSGVRLFLRKVLFNSRSEPYASYSISG